MGGTTASASVDFTALIKAYNKGMLIGESVGSSIHNTTAGLILTYRLPHTKLEINTPIVNLDFSGEIIKKLPEKYISPDLKFPIELRYKYFLQKKDVDLEETLRLIRQRQSEESN
ncbi:hypothetical protein [Niabella yanshanensis]|uniref:hypothetical protein n=1 Tax=Niabella yanshanensis TaxID=577386 RepID=UPI003741EAE2